MTIKESEQSPVVLATPKTFIGMPETMKVVEGEEYVDIYTVKRLQSQVVAVLGGVVIIIALYLLKMSVVEGTLREVVMFILGMVTVSVLISFIKGHRVRISLPKRRLEKELQREMETKRRLEKELLERARVLQELQEVREVKGAAAS